MISSVPEIQMLRHASPQIVALPDVDAQSLVKAENAVKVDGAARVAQVP